MGLRASEIAHIELSHIKDGQLEIHGKGHGKLGKVCTRPIPPEVMKVIEDYMPMRKKILEEKGDHSEDRLLVRRYAHAGCPIDRSVVADMCKTMSRKTGITFSPHTLRRLFVMTGYDNGVDLVTLRVMARHANINTTLNCYVVPLSGKRDECLNEVARILFPPL